MMTITNAKSLKTEIRDICLKALQQKAKDLQAELGQLRDGIANESKNSMGDKYETSREMMQQEINRVQSQLAGVAQQLFALNAINFERECTFAEKGALIESSQGCFLIAIAYGAVKSKGVNCFVISDVAPLAKLLLQKQAGDELTFNGKALEIFNVY